MRSSKLRDLVTVAVTAALLAVCSWITIPLPFTGVPVTMQTFAVFFAIAYIGSKRALVTYLIYLALGALGTPVFSGFGGGIGHLTGPTGGYLFGFVLTCIFCIIFERRQISSAIRILILTAGLLICYACGTAWFVIQTGSSVLRSLVLCVAPYVIPDILKILLAVFVASKMKKIIKN